MLLLLLLVWGLLLAGSPTMYFVFLFSLFLSFFWHGKKRNQWNSMAECGHPGRLCPCPDDMVTEGSLALRNTSSQHKIGQCALIIWYFAILHALFSVKTFWLSHCMFRKKKKKVIPLGMHYVYCMQWQETTTPKRLETPKGCQRVPDQCYSSLLLSTKSQRQHPYPSCSSCWHQLHFQLLHPWHGTASAQWSCDRTSPSSPSLWPSQAAWGSDRNGHHVTLLHLQLQTQANK